MFSRQIKRDMKPKKKIAPPLIITVLVIGIAIFLTLKTPLFIEFLEAKTLDIRFILRGDRDPGNEIVIVGIDEKSLAEIGRWPWSRVKIAQLIDTIAEAGAKTIGIDIFFSEPQVTESQNLLKDIRKKYLKQKHRENIFIDYLSDAERRSNADEILADSIRKAGNIILPFVLVVPTTYEQFNETDVPERLLEYSFMRTKKGSYYRPIEADEAIMSLSSLIESSQSMGNVYTQYDRDGTIRWETLYAKYGQWYFPPFGVELVRNYLDYGRDMVSPILGEGFFMGESYFPTDEAGRALINYVGRVGTFPTYSATDILAGRINKELLKDKIVLVGATAFGTFDIHVTPFANMPGVEKQASVVENILHENFLVRDETSKALDVSSLIVFGLMLGLILPKVKVRGSTLVSITLLLAYLGFANYLFLNNGIWVNTLVPSATIFMLYTSITTFRFLTEERRAREIKKMFSSYVTEKVVNELVKNPEMAKLGGERKKITVLFSDIRGFTTYSEKRQPEEIVSILNEYLTAMTEIIFKWDGTLDKFVGDEIMAFWGAPLEQKNHAELTVRCALDMMRRLSELQDKWVAEGKEPLDIGIGINSGDVLVGNMGAEGKKMDYTLIGDHVNLGARVEALTRDYNARILITEFTFELIKDIVIHDDSHFTEDSKKGTRIGRVSLPKVEAVKVKGKKKPVMIYELIDLKLGKREPA